MRKHAFEDFCPLHFTEIENYELALADNFVGWNCHHRNGEEFSTEWLLKNNMYYNRTDPHEFIFCPTSVKRGKELGIKSHGERHKGKKIHSAEWCKKHSEEMTGDKNPFYGKHHTAESNERNRQAHLGKTFSKESRQLMGNSARGKHWFTNGIISVLVLECPDGFYRGRCSRCK